MNNDVILAIGMISTIIGLSITFFIEGGEMIDLARFTFTIIAIMGVFVILSLAFYVASVLIKSLYGF